MKFRIKVKEVNDTDDNAWWESYDERIDDPEKFGKEVVQNYNDTLRPHEKPREYLAFEILSDETGKHDWVKMTYGQSVEFRGRVVDLMRCSYCGITGKRQGLNSTIKIDSKFKRMRKGKNVFEDCSEAKQELSDFPERYNR